MNRNWILFLLYAAILLTLSSWPNLSIPERLSDKWLHAAGYFLFACLFWRAFGSSTQFSLLRFTILVVGCSFFAAFDEIHQQWIPGRMASLQDWYADVAGILGIATFVLVRAGWKLQKYETA